MTTERPSRLPYLLAGLLAAVGLIVGAVWCVTALLDQIQRPEHFSRTAAPGSVTATVTSAGTYLVFVEAPRQAAIDVGPADITVSGPAGERVPVTPYGLDQRYDAPDELVGSAVAAFRADRAGDFTVTTSAGTAGQRIAVGDDLAPDVVRAIVLPGLVASLSVLGALALAFGTWLHRRTDGASGPTTRLPVVTR